MEDARGQLPPDELLRRFIDDIAPTETSRQRGQRLRRAALAARVPVERADLPDHGFAENRPLGARTQDGHALTTTLRRRLGGDTDWDAWVRKVEDQAAALAASPEPGLDVATLADAISNSAAHLWVPFGSTPGSLAAVLAAEYARLSAASPSEP